MKKKKKKSKPRKTAPTKIAEPLGRCALCQFQRPGHRNDCVWFRQDDRYLPVILPPAQDRQEFDVLRRQYASLRHLKIQAEENLLEASKRIIYLEGQNMALGQERNQAFDDAKKVVARFGALEKIKAHPIRYYLRRFLF